MNLAILYIRQMPIRLQRQIRIRQSGNPNPFVHWISSTYSSFQCAKSTKLCSHMNEWLDMYACNGTTTSLAAPWKRPRSSAQKPNIYSVGLHLQAYKIKNRISSTETALSSNAWSCSAECVAVCTKYGQNHNNKTEFPRIPQFPINPGSPYLSTRMCAVRVHCMRKIIYLLAVDIKFLAVCVSFEWWYGQRQLSAHLLRSYTTHAPCGHWLQLEYSKWVKFLIFSLRIVSSGACQVCVIINCAY